MRRECMMILSVVLALSLFGCGGGSGGRIDVQPQLTTSFSEAVSIPSALTVSRYLSEHASGGPWNSGPDFTFKQPPGLVRFAEPPTLRITEGASDKERGIALYAVDLINRALPYEQHIQIGEDAPDDTTVEILPDGQILVAFLDAPPGIGERPNAEAAADLRIEYAYDEDQQRMEKQSLLAARPWLNRTFFDAHGDDEAMLSVLVHELLHSLGLAGHASNEFLSSNMYNGWVPVTGGLPDIDAVSLQTLYTRLEPRTEPEDLSVESLGLWDSQATAHMGRYGDLSFGVTYHNGLSRPWTSGIRPDSDLAENTVIQGTVSWEGGLVGFTSDQEPLSGETAISVNLGSLSGQAEFTELKSEGAVWGDGSLDYDISVIGNFFRGIGGDDGSLSGTFYGQSHEGVAGSLERSDMTAAFGARR